MSKILTSFRWMLILCILLPSAGCSHSGIIRSYKWDPEKRSEKDIEKFFVLHKGRWWNYYERGLAFMAGGFWDEAIGDFRKSLSEMEEDHHGARTYGLNRIDYYANREAGIAYYKISQDPDIKKGKYIDTINTASNLLKKSLESVETATAQYYLRELFKNHPNIEQIEPPTIKLRDPKPRVGEDGTVTVEVENRIVKLRILIEDENLIDSIWLGKKELFFQLAKKHFEFVVNLKLNYGDNFIVIKATNLAGKPYSEKFRLIRLPKQILIQNEFIGRATVLKSNILAETVTCQAIFENATSPVRFAAKGGYYLLNLSQTSGTSTKRREQPSDSPISEDKPNQVLLSDGEIDELLPTEDRYRILPIPFNFEGFNPNIKPSNTYLDDLFYKELCKALQKDKRFSYVDLSKDELSKIKKLENRERSNIEDVRKVAKEYFSHHEIDGIIIGTISERSAEDSRQHRRLITAFLHDLEDCKPVMVRADRWDIFRFDEDVSRCAVELIKVVRNKLPFRYGHVSRVKRNGFLCIFDLEEFPLKKNMKLRIFKTAEDMFGLDTQGKITIVRNKNEEKKQQVQAIYSIKGEGEVVEKEDIVITK